MSELKQLQVIWGALVAGVVLYTAVIFGLMTAGGMSFDALDPTIMNLVGAGVMLYMAGAVFARRLLIAKIPAQAPAEDRLASYRTASIVALALMESGGLIVITLGLLAGAALWVLAGGGAAAALMFLAKPRADEIGLG